MRNLDDIGLKLCKMQAEIFEESVSLTRCSSPIFLRRFMYSDVALRMDNVGFLFESCNIKAVIEDIDNQFGETDYGKERYGAEELYWMGYLYRYWCYTFEKNSRQVYKIIKPRELRGLYYPYHSLDPAQAIDRILEAKQMKEQDFTRRGVEILREIIRRK